MEKGGGGGGRGGRGEEERGRVWGRGREKGRGRRKRERGNRRESYFNGHVHQGYVHNAQLLITADERSWNSVLSTCIQ